MITLAFSVLDNLEIFHYLQDSINLIVTRDYYWSFMDHLRNMVCFFQGNL